MNSCSSSLKAHCWNTEMFIKIKSHILTQQNIDQMFRDICLSPCLMLYFMDSTNLSVKISPLSDKIHPIPKQTWNGDFTVYGNHLSFICSVSPTWQEETKIPDMGECSEVHSLRATCYSTFQTNTLAQAFHRRHWNNTSMIYRGHTTNLWWCTLYIPELLHLKYQMCEWLNLTYHKFGK